MVLLDAVDHLFGASSAHRNHRVLQILETRLAVLHVFDARVIRGHGDPVVRAADVDVKKVALLRNLGGLCVGGVQGREAAENLDRRLFHLRSLPRPARRHDAQQGVGLTRDGVAERPCFFGTISDIFLDVLGLFG